MLFLVVTSYHVPQCLLKLFSHILLSQALAGRLAPAAPEAVEHARTHIARVFTVLAEQLQEAGDFLLGDFGFRAADIIFVHCLNWAEAIGWGNQWIEGDSPAMIHLRNYLSRCQARPAYISAKALP